MHRSKKIFHFALISILFLSFFLYSKLEISDSNTYEFAKIKINNTEFQVELAQTHDQKVQGLMHRTNLPENQGMLFIYDKEQNQSFWMKNTLIPLDIIFLNSIKEVINIESATPCTKTPCPTYKSQRPAQYVLELNSGISEKIGIKPQTQVEFINIP